MNQFLTKIGTGVTRTFARTKLFTQKYSPEILIGIGTVSIVAGVVMACRETLHVEEVLDEAQDARDAIHASDISSEEEKRALTVQTLKTAGNFAKLYAPAVSLVSGGIACFFVAHGILHKRNLALVAAYNALSTEFDEYRRRCAAELGEGADAHFKQGVVSDKESDEPLYIGPMNATCYSRFFEPGNPHYCKDMDYNLTFLEAQERTANRTLNRNGHIFLNEVYDLCGLPHTKAGAVVGWCLGNNPKGKNDGYVDITMTRCWRNVLTDETSRTPKFDGGDWQEAILLDFNPDGVIFDLI